MSRRTRHCWILVVTACAGWLSASTASAAEPGKPSRKEPLATLSSPAGETIAKLKALGNNQWLMLGAPAGNPKWCRARGRSWSCTMPFAADLHGAFLFGEDVHGWRSQNTGRYNESTTGGGRHVGHATPGDGWERPFVQRFGMRFRERVFV